MTTNLKVLTPVYVHQSSRPDAARDTLLRALRAGRVSPRFHYEGFRQSRKWLELYRRWSPFVNDPDCRRIYREAFLAAGSEGPNRAVDVVGLGCGGGQKERALIEALRPKRRMGQFLACDASAHLVLSSAENVAPVIGPARIRLLVCDLAQTDDLRNCLDDLLGRRRPRVLTFFGMIPNFEPRDILPRLSACLRSQDRLLLSVNLAPGDDYSRGLKKVLPQYDNAETRAWLNLLLRDIGLTARHGRMVFGIARAAVARPWRRIEAVFEFFRPARADVLEETVSFARGDRLKVFFSYRYSLPMMVDLLANHGLAIRGRWITANREEAVLLAQRE